MAVHHSRFARTAAALIGTACLLGSSASAQSTSTTVYREQYPYCTGSLGTPASEQAGWRAFKSGLAVGKLGNLKVFSPGVAETGPAVNSDPVGFSPGFAFWSRAVFGLTIFTTEFSFDVSLLDTVEYDQRLTGINTESVPNGTRLAFLIGNTWYLQETVQRQTNFGRNWSHVTVSPFSETYGTSPASNVGPQIPSNSGVLLPTSGVVTAFGVFLDEVNGRVRIDNYTINGVLSAGSGISTAPQDLDGSRCPAGSPDTNPGSVPPTPNPSQTPGGGDDDGDPNSGGNEQEIPDEEVPPQLATPTPTVTASAVPTSGPTGIPTGVPTGVVTPTATETPAVSADAFAFCPAAQEGAGKRVKFSRAARKALLKLAAAPAAIDLRDAAIVGVLGSRLLPAGAIVNATLSDYSAAASTIEIVPGKGKAAKAIGLNKKANAILARYVSQVRFNAKASAPLFVAAQPKTKILTASSATCLKEVLRTVRGRAKKAKIAAEVTYVK